MTLCVLDCSIAITWCFEDESTPATDAILAAVATTGAAVPPLWALEFANTLRNGLRRGRIDPARLRPILDRLARLPIRQLGPLPGHPVRLAESNLERTLASGLTAYDQSYLEAARDAGLPLATVDSALRRAAAAAGIALLPP